MNALPINLEQTEKYKNKVLLKQTENLPCKIIEINGQPYLERYFVGHDGGGNQLWLHHFLTADGERHHHSHPWHATSQILTGGYCEETLNLHSSPELQGILGSVSAQIFNNLIANNINARVKMQRWLLAGDSNLITPSTLHRIVEVKPNTWSALTVSHQRAENWFFIDENDNRQTMQASPRDWWQTCTTRNGGCYDRNALALA